MNAREKCFNAHNWHNIRFSTQCIYYCNITWMYPNKFVPILVVPVCGYRPMFPLTTFILGSSNYLSLSPRSGNWCPRSIRNILKHWTLKGHKLGGTFVTTKKSSIRYRITRHPSAQIYKFGMTFPFIQNHFWCQMERAAIFPFENGA